MKSLILIILIAITQITFATTPIYGIEVTSEKLDINAAKDLGFEISSYSNTEDKITIFIGSPLFIEQRKSTNFSVTYYFNNEYVAFDSDIEGQRINHIKNSKDIPYVSHEITINKKYINKIEIDISYKLDTGSNFKSDIKSYIITVNKNDF